MTHFFSHFQAVTVGNIKTKVLCHQVATEGLPCDAKTRCSEALYLKLILEKKPFYPSIPV